MGHKFMTYLGWVAHVAFKCCNAGVFFKISAAMLIFCYLKPYYSCFGSEVLFTVLHSHKYSCSFLFWCL